MILKTFECIDCMERIEEIVDKEVEGIKCPKCEGVMLVEFTPCKNFKLNGSGYTPKFHK